jgi:hypothetical protein
MDLIKRGFVIRITPTTVLCGIVLFAYKYPFPYWKYLSPILLSFQSLRVESFVCTEKSFSHKSVCVSEIYAKLIQVKPELMLFNVQLHNQMSYLSPIALLPHSKSTEFCDIKITYRSQENSVYPHSYYCSVRPAEFELQQAM